MKPQSILLGIAAGLISAVVLASATAGTALTRAFFFLLTPFPLFLAGLGLGIVPVMAGAATATLALLAVSNPLTATMFAAEAALPAVILTRLSLLSRESGKERVWYPVGRIVAVAAVLAAAATAALLFSAGVDEQSLVEKLKPPIVEFLKTQFPTGPDSPIDDEKLSVIAQAIVPLVPGLLALVLMAMSLASLWLAGRVTLASGRLARPWPDFTALELPPGSALVLIAAFALSFAGGRMGPPATAFAGTFELAFALQGLAVLHALTSGWSWRGFVLAATYAALVVQTPIAVSLLALGGLADAAFHYRWPRDPGLPLNRPRN